MAMGASQARLLSLTSRKSNLEFDVQTLTNRRTSLVNESAKISQEYTARLQKKEFKWSLNNGSTYSKLSYCILMKPSSLNGNTPYFISDKNGKIVLNSEYADYAERFSPKGAPMSGSWADSEMRYQLLAELTGLKEEKIKANEDGIKENEQKRNNAQFYLGASDYYANQANAKLNNGTNVACSHKEWIEAMCKSLYRNTTNLSVTVNTPDDSAYSATINDWENIKSNIKKAIKEATTSKGNMTEEEINLLWDAYDNTIGNNSGNFLDFTDGNMRELFNQKKKDEIGNPTISYSTLLDTLATTFKGYLINVTNPKKKAEDLSENEQALRKQYESRSADSNVVYTLYNANSDSLNCRKAGWTELVEQSDNYLTYFNEVVGKEYDEAVNKNNQIFTSAEENLIKFYDRLFESIWTNGWVENNSVMDSEYLNNVLQNGQYFVTQQNYISGDEWYQCFSSMAINNTGSIMTGNFGNDTTFKYQTDDGTEYEITVQTFDYGVLKSKAESHFPYYPDRYEYVTTMANDFSKLFSVSDSDEREEAQADYDYKKKLIEVKERRLDTIIKNKETELNSIQEMIKTTENLLKGGIEKFNVFS